MAPTPKPEDAKFPSMNSAYSLVSQRLEDGVTGFSDDYSRQKGWRSYYTPRNILLGLLLGIIIIFISAASKVNRTRVTPTLPGFEILQSATAQAGMHHQLPDAPKVCVIARTYGAQFSYLPIFLLSLWHGGFPNIQVFILNTDTSMKTSDMQQALDLVNLVTGSPNYATFLDWPITTSGDYGYALTDDALLYLYAEENAHFGCEYVMVSNGDNVYTQGFANYLKPGMDKGAGLIGFDFVSHHQWWDYRSTFDGKAYIDSAGSLVCRAVEFRTNWIDLGAAMFKFSLIKEHNLTFIGTGEYGWVSDGHFIEAVNQIAPITFVQHSILLLHQ